MFKSKNRISDQFFKDRIQIDLDSGCWNWARYVQSGGYGQFRYDNRPCLAHRASWSFYNQSEIPESLCILHHCDNPRCINPKHLFLGTILDNAQDCTAKTRHLKGFCKGHVHGRKKRKRKLTDDQVREIRATLYNREPLRTIAERYNISLAHVSLIRRDKRKQLIPN